MSRKGRDWNRAKRRMGGDRPAESKDPGPDIEEMKRLAAASAVPITRLPSAESDGQSGTMRPKRATKRGKGKMQ